MTENDHEAIAAHVARAWEETDLPQSQFAAHLQQLARGYAVAPEVEAEAATIGASRP